MNSFRAFIKTTRVDHSSRILPFYINADSAYEIRDFFGSDIDVAKFITWYGYVDLVTGQLIDDGQEIPKHFGEVCDMKLLNIEQLSHFTENAANIRTYSDSCEKYDFNLNEIYDIDWFNAID